MRVFKQLIFMAFVIIVFSMTATAQRQDDNQNRPPKKDPPQIVPPDKDRPRDRPRDDNNNNTNRPKKPQSVIFVSGKQTEISFV